MGFRFLLFTVFLFGFTFIEAQTPTDSINRKLPEVLIQGNFPAYANAIREQRKAEGIVHMLNLDIPGRFPDLNPAESLSRLPGIAVQRSHGEGRFIHVRGLDPSLSTVRMNGEPLISPEGQNRFLQFDLIPVDQLQGIAVWKTNRPDQDGDAIGGSIDLITRKPSAQKPHWQGALASGFNPKANRPNSQAQLSYSRNRLLVNGSYWQDHRLTENLETLYDFDAPAPNIKDLELRYFEVSRRRISLSTEYVLPFKHTDGQLFCRAMWMDFQEENLRQRLRYRPGEGIASNDTIFGAQIGRDIQYVRETERLLNIQTGFERFWKGWKWDGQTTFSKGRESEPEGAQLDFRIHPVDLIQTSRNAAVPFFQVLNGNEANRYAGFRLHELEQENDHSDDHSFSANANGQLGIFNKKGFIKTGLKVRIRNKSTRSSESIYDDFTGPSPIPLEDLLQNEVYQGFRGNPYPFGQPMNWHKTKDFITQNKPYFQLNAYETALESTAGNFDVHENTGAGYILAHLEKGPWQWLAGARLESTQYRYAADLVTIDSALEVKRLPGGRKFAGQYAFLLPTVLSKYKGKNGLLWQLATGASYSRPNFDQLAPFELLDQLNLTVTAGNPGLKPAKAWNFDLSIEKPLQELGSLSAVLFGKRIQDYIFTQERMEYRNWNGNQIRVRSSIPQNAALAWLAGLELNWQQALTFLPGAWSGLGIYANYTHTWSRAFAMEEEAGEKEEEGFRLPGQAAHTGNLALWYDQKKWSARLALNGQSSFLLQVAEPEETNSQLIYGGSIQMDASISFSLGHHGTLFAEGMNLLNTPLRYYYGDKNYPAKIEYYGAWGRLGIKWKW